jgi:putative transcriptional regulator
MVTHTPPEELLFDYAAGTLPEPLALFVASHLTFAPQSRRTVREMEAVGGDMLADLAPAPMADDALDRMMARLDTPSGSSAEPARESVATGPTPGPGAGGSTTPRGIPGVLKRYVDTYDWGALAWKERSPSIREYKLLDDQQGYKTRLLRLSGNTAVPEHTHEGSEYTLCLEGGFTDAGREYWPGDVAVADGEVDHAPVAVPEGCTCLIVTTAPLRMTGPVGRFLNLFVDI